LFCPGTGAALLLALTASGAAAETAPEDPIQQHPQAVALCDALHTLPAKRKQECCGRVSPSLAVVCVQELSASLGRGAVSVDRAAVERCASDVSRQLEGCQWVTPLLPPAPESCRSLVAGKLAKGAACRSSLECADGFFCRGVRPDQAGACASPAAAGSRCEVPADNLASFTGSREDPRHLVCDGLCVKGQCLPVAPAGGACESSARCRPGLNCISGTCQDSPLPRVGESCAGNTSCVAGAFCQAGRCAAAKGAGEACASPVECQAFQCVVAAGSKTGACAEPCGPGGGALAKPSTSPR
jgi:hypothetical protein